MIALTEHELVILADRRDHQHEWAIESGPHAVDTPQLIEMISADLVLPELIPARAWTKPSYPYEVPSDAILLDAFDLRLREIVADMTTPGHDRETLDDYAATAFMLIAASTKLRANQPTNHPT